VCDTCGHAITARVLIGGNTRPVYTFPCPNCAEDVQLGLEIALNPPSLRYLYLKNCHRGTQEGTVVNLSAEVAIPRDLINRDRYPAALFVDRELFGSVRAKAPVIPQVVANWTALKRAWSLSIRGKTEIAKQYLADYRSPIGGEVDRDLNSQIYDYIFFFLAPNRYRKVIAVFESLRIVQEKNITGYKRFIGYYAKKHRERLSRRYLGHLSDFMDNFEAIYPLLMYERIGKEPDPKLVSSSFDFESLKMFYGNAFELLADAFIIPSGINNLLAGRQFDQFESMNLDKYLTIDKAGRANPFKDSGVVGFLAEEFDSGIRNASHHGNIQLSASKEYVLYSYGKPPKEHQLTVSGYLLSCARAVLNVMAILAIGLFLVEHDSRFSPVGRAITSP
jgi:hypothetical protein